MHDSSNTGGRAPWRARLEALGHIPSVFKLVWDAAPGLVSASVTLRAVTALLPVTAVWIAKLIIDLIVANLGHHGAIPTRIWWLLGAQFVVAAAGLVFGRAIDYCDARLADEFSREVSLRIMRHAATLDLASFEDPGFYDTLERARVQAGDRVGLLHATGTLLQQAIAMVSFAAGVILFSPVLFVLLVVSVVPAFLVESRFAFLGYALAFSLTPLRRQLDYLRVLATSRESAKEMKLFGLAPYVRGRFTRANDEIIERNRALLRRRLGAGSLMALISSLAYYASYAYLVVRTLQGHLTVGDLTFLAAALAETSGKIQSVLSSFAGIADQSLFLGDLRRFFEVQSSLRCAEHPVPAPRPIREGFELRGVSFAYPGTNRLVLRDLNLRIGPRERIALVGRNGQGKTTLVKLLTRLYDPTDGAILLDGVDLREYDLEDLHREIGVIFQDFVRYDLTARENIAVGRIEDLDDEVRLREAAHKSQATDVLEKLPGGLAQMLGRRFDRGIDLSGGEWQKFALARAYMRNAQVLVLDEPSAALDAAAEYEIFSRFAALTVDRMAILISHRFSTVRMCDRIVVVENGVVREQGSHEQLLARGGRYADMFNLQAAHYR